MRFLKRERNGIEKDDMKTGDIPITQKTNRITEKVRYKVNRELNFVVSSHAEKAF